LCTNPSWVVDELHGFLVGKLQDYERQKMKCNSTWREVYTKNTILAKNDYGNEWKEIDERNRSTALLYKEIKEDDNSLLLPLSANHDVFQDILTFVGDIQKKIFPTSVSKDISALCSSFLPAFVLGTENQKSPGEEDSQLAAILESISISLPKVEKHKIVFFGGLEFYLFVRLYQIIFSRFEEARSHKVKKSEHARPVITKHSVVTDGFFPNASETTTTTVTTTKEGYTLWLDFVRKLVKSDISAMTYEIQVMKMWGTKAYDLFGINALLVQFARQIGLLCQHATTIPLLKTYATYLESLAQEQDYDAALVEYQHQHAKSQLRDSFQFKFSEDTVSIELQ